MAELEGELIGGCFCSGLRHRRRRRLGRALHGGDGGAEALLREHDDEAAAVRSQLDDPDLDVDLSRRSIFRRYGSLRRRPATLPTASVSIEPVASRARQAAELAARIERLEVDVAPARASYQEVAGLMSWRREAPATGCGCR